MKHCDYCGGLENVNDPVVNFTNEQGSNDCYKHKDLRSCILTFRIKLSNAGGEFMRTFRDKEAANGI